MEIESELPNHVKQLETTNGSLTDVKRRWAMARERRRLQTEKLRQHQEKWMKIRRDWKIFVVFLLSNPSLLDNRD